MKSKTKSNKTPLTARQRRQNYTAHALIHASKQGRIPLPRRAIDVEASVVGALDARLESVERVDEEVDGECCDGTGLERGRSVVSYLCFGRWWCWRNGV